MKSDHPTWALETHVFPEKEEQSLLSLLESIGVEFCTPKAHELSRFDRWDQIDIPRGSCFFVRQFSQQRSWLGDVWGNPEDFDCSRYYPKFGHPLINKDGRIMSINELLWKLDSIRDELDSQGDLFIRPDDGFKSFEGEVVSSEGIDQWLNRLSLLQIPRHTKILVASPRRLTSEWRIQMVDGKAVAASRYRPVWEQGAPTEVLEYAENVASNAAWNVRAYAMDIATTESGLGLVEVGCILCMAFYESDPRAIVHALQELVAECRNGNTNC